MTPLAHKITKELTLLKSERTFLDQCSLLTKLDDIHCFDVTQVLPLVDEFANEHFFNNFDEKIAFLPADKTWIEFEKNGMRTGALLVKTGDGADVFTAAVDKLDGAFMSFDEPLFIRMPSFTVVGRDMGYSSSIATTIYGALVLINTPHLIGRRQHMPHRGLERRLTNMKGLVGKFPLHAWTELKLSVSAMMKQSDGTEHEAHLTGERCLHFCRAHLRVRNGRLEQVRPHWRGNPALGIKRTRYLVTA